MRVILRFALAIVFSLIGALIGKLIFHPQEAFFIVLAIFAFGILGFILPEFLELAGRAGLSVVAAQIVKYLQEVQASHLTVPSLSFKRNKKAASKYINPLVLDTSALIDGRILDIAASGFMFGTLIVSEAVISELQTLADNGDKLKRGKGRRGLDTLSALQKEKKLRVLVLPATSKEKVDDLLVTLSKKLKASLITLDFNLNKVAKIKKVPVLNINELASSLKTIVVPGQRMILEIIDKGSGQEQGVGYLADGTMVVVEEGLPFKGKSIDIEVLRVLPTPAGKMIFAKPL